MGLWSIENEIPGTGSTRLYFTACLVEQIHGIFGFLKRRNEKDHRPDLY